MVMEYELVVLLFHYLTESLVPPSIQIMDLD